MSFHEIRISEYISYGATGGPRRKTEIIELASGHEERNSPWSQSRREYNIAYGVRDVNDMAAIIEFFEAREGSLFGFRYKDWADYKSVRPLAAVTPNDQAIGTGTGALTTFQLVKNYTDTANTQVRVINKPVLGTTRVSLNNVEQMTGWTVSTITGAVVFSVAPGAGVIVRAGYEFDVPVRFKDDSISSNLSNFELGNVGSINLIEVLI